MKNFEQKNGKVKILITTLFLGVLLTTTPTYASDLQAPVNVRASVPTVGQIKVSFDDNNDVAAAKNYVKCSSGDSSYVDTKAGKSPITLTAKKDGAKYKKYTCTVASVQTVFSPDDTLGPESARSNEVDPNKADVVVIPIAPSAPQNVIALAGDTQATITWKAPASNGNADITKYIVSTSTSVVEVGVSGRDVSPLSGALTGLFTYTYTGLTNEKPYTFYVRAENSAGSSIWASSGVVVPKVGASSTKIGDDGSNPTTIGDGGANNSSQNGLSINIAYKNPLHKTASDIPSFVAVVLKAIAKLLFPIVVIMILYSGFLFVIARGNVEKIGDAKKALTYALVGGMIVLGAYGLAQIVQEILVSIVS
jgi:hypothetical protein